MKEKKQKISKDKISQDFFSISVTHVDTEEKQPKEYSPKGFISWIKVIFHHWISPKKKKQIKIEPLLSERVQKLETIATDVLSQLQSAKEDLKEAVDSEVFSYVERVIEPMVKGVNRIHKMSEKRDTESEQVNALEKYSEWISEAEQWVGVLHDRQAVIKKAIVRHFAEISRERINRDLRIIDDYKRHRLAELHLPESEEGALSQRIDLALANFLDPLKALGHYQPENLTLEQSDARRSIVDLQRERFSNQALQAVDKVIHEIETNGTEESPLVRENLLVNFREMEDLESALPKLLIEIQQINKANKMERHQMQKTLFALEEMASELDDKIHLTPELNDRLEQVKKNLDKAHQQLAN